MIAVGAVGDHHGKRDPLGLRGGDQLGGQPVLGGKRRVALAGGQQLRGRVGRQVGWPVDVLVRPARGDHHDPGVDLADTAQVLAGDVRHGRAVFSVPAVIDDQHPALVRGGDRIAQQQPEALVVDGLRIQAPSVRYQCSRWDAWSR
jgi:hypothetical protein